MSKNIRTTGDTVKVVASADVSSGDPVAIGTSGADRLTGVAEGSAKSGEMFLLVRNFVADLPKGTGAISAGAKLFLNSSGEMTTTAGSDPFFGYCAVAAESADSTVRVVSRS